MTESSEGDGGDGTLGLLQMIWRLDHSLQKLSKAMASRLGVTGPQRLALRVIGNADGITPGELSRALCLHPSTVTGIVQRLERGGFVARAAVPEDGRRCVLTLTRAGRPLARPIAGTVEDAARRAVGRCRPGDVESARRVIDEMSGELEASAGRYARGKRSAPDQARQGRPRKARPEAPRDRRTR